LTVTDADDGVPTWLESAEDMSFERLVIAESPPGSTDTHGEITPSRRTPRPAPSLGMATARESRPLRIWPP
jgi:hypothetical protein